MRGNISKRGLNGSKGEKGDKGDTPSIEFEYNAATGELKYRSDGILVNKDYISSHDIVTKDQVNELKQFVITLDDKFAGDKTYDEIVGAFKEGREIVGLLPPRVPGAYEMLRFTVAGYTNNTVTLSTFMPYEQLLITCNKDNVWSSGLRQMVTEDVLDNRISLRMTGTERTTNKVKHIDKENATDDKYPSEKAVVQHVATEMSTVNARQRQYEEQAAVHEDKINAHSVQLMNHELQISQNKSECDLRFDDSNTRIESLYSMLSVQEDKNGEQDARLDAHDEAIVDIEGLRNELFAEIERNDSQEATMAELNKAVNDLILGNGNSGGSSGSGGSAFASLIVNTGVTFQEFANTIKEPGMYQLTRKEIAGNRLTSCAYLIVTKHGQYKEGCSQFLISSDESVEPSLMFRQFMYNFDIDAGVEEEFFTEWTGVASKSDIDNILNGDSPVGFAQRALGDNEGNIIHETYVTKEEVGNVDDLKTMYNSNLVAAINELKDNSDSRLLEHSDDIMMVLEEINAIKADYATKAELYPTPIKTVPTTLNANKPYNLGTLTELSLLFPTTANDGDVIYITFECAETSTNLTVDTTNTSDFDLIPEVNTGYEIYAKYNGSIWIVKYSEYTKPEVA